MFRTLAAILMIVIGVPTTAMAQSLADDSRVASAIGLLQAWVDAEQAYNRIPSVSMAVVHDQDVVWRGAFGFSHLERRTPATTRTIYSICSISKLFTSIGVMQLRDQGKLRLDDPLSEHLSWFALERTHDEAPEITIQGLLTHSSGLPRESDYPYWTGPEFDFPTRQQVIERLSSQETLYPADRYFQYSNLGLTLAGELIVALGGQPYGEYVRRNILETLGLDDTTPEIPVEQRGGRLATGYGARTREGERAKLNLFQARGIAPAAGYASTVEDLARFASWQFRLLEKGGREVLHANTLREMHRVHWVDEDWDVHWGLGFAVWRNDDKTFVGHGGGCPGYRSHLLMQTDEKFAAVVMTNAIDVNSNEFTRVAYSVMGPAIKRAVEAPGEGKEPDAELRRYIGAYETAWGGELAVLPWEDQLVMVYLPTDDPMDNLTKLEHVDGHLFRRIRDDGELGESIEFEVDASGAVTRLKRHSNYYPKVR